jgi:hypothetical protein
MRGKEISGGGIREASNVKGERGGVGVKGEEESRRSIGGRGECGGRYREDGRGRIKGRRRMK